MHRQLLLDFCAPRPLIRLWRDPIVQRGWQVHYIQADEEALPLQEQSVDGKPRTPRHAPPSMRSMQVMLVTSCKQGCELLSRC